MSWAWNSVIGEYDDESVPVDSETSTSIAKSSVILSIGVYLKTGSILMKSGRRPARTLFGIYFDGTGVEIVNQGDSFFSAVFGMTSLTVRYFGSLPSYMNPFGGEGPGSKLLYVVMVKFIGKKEDYKIVGGSVFPYYQPIYSFLSHFNSRPLPETETKI